MKVIIAGGSGWIGRALSRSLTMDGHDVIVLSRSSQTINGVRSVRWDGATLGPWALEIDGADAIVNLTGASIAQERWSPTRKAELIRSRIGPASVLVQAIQAAGQRPAVFVQGSAVGYYGDQGDTILGENAGPGSDFLAGLVIGWEAVAEATTDLGVRLVLSRTAVVLGQNGGALPRMALAFRLFLGGSLGSGQQWFPWIHKDDVVGLIAFALANPLVEGPINAVAPESVRANEFAQTLGEVLGRPSWLPAPRIALRIALGEVADALLASQHVVPDAAERLGYVFTYPNLKPALEAVLA
jgi:uncharacterized protein (TIGR01777 family)